jgi:hypothetical protein
VRLTLMHVSPVNCQVVLIVPDAEELPPVWPTGQEPVVGNSGAIYVGTICEVDGEVTVEVWQAEELPHPHREPIYDGSYTSETLAPWWGASQAITLPISRYSPRACIASASTPTLLLSMFSGRSTWTL